MPTVQVDVYMHVLLCIRTKMRWTYMLDYSFNPLSLPPQITPASSSCPQSCLPKPGWLQVSILLSVPLQRTSSNQIGPLPLPK